MYNLIKSIFMKKKSYVNSEGERYNENSCTFCNIKIEEDRFSYHKGKHFHRRCINKWYLNDQEPLKNE